MTVATSPLRIGLIGCGGISNAHVRGYKTLGPDVVQVVATSDVATELAQRRAQELGSAQASTDYRAVLANPAVDAVDICLPHHLHAEVAIAAARAGKHVLVEKPMACSIEQCRAMVQAAEQAGVTLMVAQVQRYTPSYRGVKRLVQSGELGAIRGVRFDSMQNLQLAPEHWLYDGTLAGGGIIISVSVHRLDLIRYFIGEVRRVTALCRLGDPPFKNGAESYAAAVLEFTNGAIGEHFATYSGFRMPYSESFMLFGDDGAVHALPEPGHSQGSAFYASRGHDGLAPDAPRWERQFTGFLPVEPDRQDLPGDDGFTNEIAHFVACCRSGEEPLTSGRDNLGTMAIIFAIYESACRGGVPVDVAGA
ncbi:MAG: Gfo/Idh/MocA family oxidoreductase [Chloroflexi bacterium]|nr:Gfo/Idh/MocA family oxidoreductase [Chloroflexota bacterium]